MYRYCEVLTTTAMNILIRYCSILLCWFNWLDLSVFYTQFTGDISLLHDYLFIHLKVIVYSGH
jgi:hypothetical protein